VARWVVALAKIAVAVGVTLVLTVPPMLVTGLLIGTAAGGSVGSSLAFVLAALAGGAAYASVFTTLGALTTRALVVGLAYTLLWEGALAGLLEGTRFLSIRQATLGIAAALGGGDADVATLDPTASVLVVVLAVAGSFVLATLALQRFQVRAGD
jgi:hypothetical protein